MLKSVQLFVLSCDRCGRELDTPDEATRYFHTLEQAIDVAVSDEWVHEGGDKVTCYDCQGDE